jgi:glycosyltransferase involved in cell wall biosynthesis
MTQGTSTTTRIAYLLNSFPRLSQTFILHEILELERQGLDLRLFSIRNPDEEIVHADVGRVRAPVTYLPTGWHATWAMLRAHLALVRRGARRYVGALAFALQRRRSTPFNQRLASVKHFWRAGWLARELEQAGVTHLHAHFAHSPASVAHFVHLLTGLPYSFTAHARDIYTSPPDLLAVKIRAARFVVTCTGYNARYLAELVGDETAGRIHRIYHGLDLHKFSPSAGPPAQLGSAPGRVQPRDTPTILAVGRLVEKKGYPYLIEACRLLIDRGYDVRLRIVGGGQMKDALRRHIAEVGLDERVELLGARPQDEVIELYRTATVFALPCVVLDNGDRDGIPNVLVEAMRLGLPVVSTAVSGIPELVGDETTGLLVPPRDAEALASALARLLDDAQLRTRLATGAAHRVAREFDLAANAARLKALLVEAPAW